MLALYLVPAVHFLHNMPCDDRVLRTTGAMGFTPCVGFLPFGLTEVMLIIAQTVSSIAMVGRVHILLAPAAAWRRPVFWRLFSHACIHRATLAVITNDKNEAADIGDVHPGSVRDWADVIVRLKQHGRHADYLPPARCARVRDRSGPADMRVQPRVARSPH